MPVPEFTSTKSEKPRLAPKGWSSWEPIRRLSGELDRTSVWAGSGFLISDLLMDWWFRNTVTCGHCGSRKTLCIYLNNNQNQFDCEVKLEIQCRKCGKFTQYEGSD